MSVKESKSHEGAFVAPAATPSLKESTYSAADDYEPAEVGQQGREREQGGSAFLAYFNVVCVVAGTGALQLPYALRQGGWIGILILCLSWFFSTYSSIILIRCLYHNGRTRLSSYQEIAQDAFGIIGYWAAFFFSAISLIGVPILYVMLAGQNLHTVTANTTAELTLPIWTIISAIVVGIPFIFFKSLKEVGFTSAFGVLTTVIVVFIVLGAAVQDDRVPRSQVHHDPVIWDQFPIALSSIAFSFGGNPVYCHVEAGMRKPHHWKWVIFGGLSTCVAIYFLTAVPGYFIYGDEVKSPVYMSLPEGPSQMAAAIIITAHVLLAMPILMTSFALDLEKMMHIASPNRPRWLQWTLRLLLRIVYLVVVVIVAVEVPSFGSIMSLLGAFSNCTLIFIFPIVFYYRLTGLFNKPFYELFVGAIAIVLGIVGLIFGSKSAIEELKLEYASQ